MAMRSGCGKQGSRRFRTTGLTMIGLVVASEWLGLRAAVAADCNGRRFERVSVSSSSAQGNQRSLLPDLSFDGCTVGFKSDATNLVGNDNNQVTDVFVRDRVADTTTRVSVASDGREADDFSFPPALSSDGQLVAFGSAAANLVLDDANHRADTFLKNRTSGVVTRASLPLVQCPLDNPNNCGGGSRDEPSAITYNGRFVAFASDATNLALRDINETTDVFVRDLDLGTTALISRAAVGAERGDSANGPSHSPVLNGDGRYVVFVSKATDFINGTDPDNTLDEIILWDNQQQQFERISVTINGRAADGPSRNPTITDDGRYVAFASAATNLVPGDTNEAVDVFIRDRVLRVTTRVEPPDGCATGGAAAIAPNAFSDAPSFSGDGRFLAFVSLASNFVAGDTKNVADIMVLDRSSGLIARILGEGGVEPDGASNFPNLSGDGEWVTFQSDATNLVADDSNGVADIFVAFNPFLTGEAIPGVTPLPTCTPTDTPTSTPTTTPTPCDAGCPTGLVCVADRCVTPTPTVTPTSCAANGCAAGLVCSMDRCVTPTPTATATSCVVQGCPGGFVCSMDRCVTPTPTGSITATPVRTCSRTDQCPAPQVCIGGQCVPPGACDSDDDCPPGDVCDVANRRCVPRPSPTVTRTPASGGGGGGCSCRVDPRTATSEPEAALAFVLPAALWGLRRRGLRRRP